MKNVGFRKMHGDVRIRVRGQVVLQNQKSELLAVQGVIFWPKTVEGTAPAGGARKL